MAIVRPGALVGGISGALGSSVFANTRAGLVVRPRGVRTGAASSALALRQGDMGRVINAWNALTSAQRAAWATAALTRGLPNRLGVVRPISGFQLYCQYALGVYGGSPPAALAPPTQSLIYAPTFVGVNFLEGGPYAITSRGAPFSATLPVEFGFIQSTRRATQTSGFSRVRRVGSWTHPYGSYDVYALAQAAGITLFDTFPFAAGVSWQVGGGYMGKRFISAGTVGGVPWTITDFEDGSLSAYAGDLSSFSIVSSPVHGGAKSLQVSFTNAASVTRAIYSYGGLPVYPVLGHVFEVWMRLETTNTDRVVFRFAQQDTSNYYRFNLRSTGVFGTQKIVAGVSTNLALGTIPSFAVATWYRFVMSWAYSGVQTVYAYNTGGTQLASASASDSTFVRGGFGFAAINVAGAAALGYFDDAKITGRAS